MAMLSQIALTYATYLEWSQLVVLREMVLKDPTTAELFGRGIYI